MQDQPSDRGAVGDDGVELPDELAPDPDLRAARKQIQAVGASLREALAADDLLAAGGRLETAAADGPVKR